MDVCGELSFPPLQLPFHLFPSRRAFQDLLGPAETHVFHNIKRQAEMGYVTAFSSIITDEGHFCRNFIVNAVF